MKIRGKNCSKKQQHDQFPAIHTRELLYRELLYPYEPSGGVKSNGRFKRPLQISPPPPPVFPVLYVRNAEASAVQREKKKPWTNYSMDQT
jgi:hypothetical protein